MKTNIYSAVIRFVKGYIAITVLGTIFFNLDLNAQGTTIGDPVRAGKELPIPTIKSENQAIPDKNMQSDAINSELNARETEKVILQWMSDKSFWVLEDSTANENLGSTNNQVSESFDLSGSFSRIKAFILFQTQKFISTSEF